MSLFGLFKSVSSGWDPEDEEYDPDEDDEEESEFETVQEAINSVSKCWCPNCDGDNTMENTGDGYFVCSSCGYMEDGELTVERLHLW